MPGVDIRTLAAAMWDLLVQQTELEMKRRVAKLVAVQEELEKIRREIAIADRLVVSARASVARARAEYVTSRAETSALSALAAGARVPAKLGERC